MVRRENGTRFAVRGVVEKRGCQASYIADARSRSAIPRIREAAESAWERTQDAPMVDGAALKALRKWWCFGLQDDGASRTPAVRKLFLLFIFSCDAVYQKKE